MWTIRPVRPGDAPALADLLKPAAPAADPAAVQRLIAESRQAQDGDGPVPHRLVLVLDDPAAGLIGAVTLAGSTGLDLPRATYRTGTVVHASAELQMFHRAPTLLLCNDLTGCAELGLPMMAAADDARRLQRLLVDAALLFVAAHADRFAPTLVCELPGIGGAYGASPFWQGLGRHFHAGALPPDSAFFPAPERSHIARLMPKHPLYSALLGPDAQACIGRHAASAQALAEALHAQGLRHRGQVNLFDAGPVLEAEVGDLAAVRLGRRCRVVLGEGATGDEGDATSREESDGATGPKGHTCLLAGAAPAPGGDWQAHLATGQLGDGVFRLAPAQASALGLVADQVVRVLPQA